MFHSIKNLPPMLLLGVISLCPATLMAQPGQNLAQQPPTLPSASNVVSATTAVTTAVTTLESSILDRGRYELTPTYHCAHVIDLLLMNRTRQNPGHDSATAELFLPYSPVGVAAGDLELVCVNMICAGDQHVQPAYQLALRNNSQYPVGDFCVSVVAVLGRIHPGCPSTSLRVVRMEAGEQVTFQVQLPFTAMNMILPGQLSAPFDTIVVAVDSFDQLIEGNELNNVLVLKRADVQPLVVQTTVVTESAVHAQAAPPAPGPNSNVPPAPAAPPAGAISENAAPPAPPAPEVEQRPVSPLDKIDLDKLELN